MEIRARETHGFSSGRVNHASLFPLPSFSGITRISETLCGAKTVLTSAHSTSGFTLDVLESFHISRFVNPLRSSDPCEAPIRSGSTGPLDRGIDKANLTGRVHPVSHLCLNDQTRYSQSNGRDARHDLDHRPHLPPSDPFIHPCHRHRPTHKQPHKPDPYDGIHFPGVQIHDLPACGLILHMPEIGPRSQDGIFPAFYL